MAQLLGTPDEYDAIKTELRGVIFKDPMGPDDPEAGWQTADEYLSGDVRRKLRIAEMSAKHDPSFNINVEALQKAQPKDLDASEIDVRLGATWIDAEIYMVGKALRQLCDRYEATLILDDVVRMVPVIGADGVHLGKQDMPVDEARKLLGPDKIIGGTANTFEDVKRLAQQSANHRPWQLR